MCAISIATLADAVERLVASGVVHDAMPTARQLVRRDGFTAEWRRAGPDSSRTAKHTFEMKMSCLRRTARRPSIATRRPIAMAVARNGVFPRLFSRMPPMLRRKTDCRGH